MKGSPNSRHFSPHAVHPLWVLRFSYWKSMHPGVCSGNQVGATLHRLPTETPIPMLWKSAFMGGVIALAALAWLPADAVTRTTLGAQAEHLIAYLSAATLMGFATRTTRRLVVQALLLIGYAAILEVGQCMQLVVRAPSKISRSVPAVL